MTLRDLETKAGAHVRADVFNRQNVNVIYFNLNDLDSSGGLWVVGVYITLSRFEWVFEYLFDYEWFLMNFRDARHRQYVWLVVYFEMGTVISCVFCWLHFQLAVTRVAFEFGGLEVGKAGGRTKQQNLLRQRQAPLSLNWKLLCKCYCQVSRLNIKVKY